MLNPQLLKLAIEVIKELPPGAVYADASTPSDAQISANPSGRGRGHWFPKQYAADKNKKLAGAGRKESPISELRSYVKENHSKLYEAMQQQLPDLSDDQLKEQITTSKKRLRGLDKGRDAYKIHQLAIAMGEQEQIKRQKKV